MKMTEMKFKDISKYQGLDFLEDGYDGYIPNITPQNNLRDQQIQIILNAGKLIGYYSWPLSFAPTPVEDAQQAAAFVNGWIAQNPAARGPVAIDIEQGSYTGDPVSLSAAWLGEIERHNLGPMIYLAYPILKANNWGPCSGYPLWFPEYTSNPDTDYAPWSVATIWQDSDNAPGGGDDNIVYCDAGAWEKLGYPGGSPVPAPAPVEAPAPAPAPVQSGGPTGWDVDPGDTLSGIAAAVGVTLEALEAANPWIANPDVIQVGWHLALPAGAHWPTGAQAQPTSQYNYYTIAPGDTLSGIANKFGVTVDALLSMNPFITNPDVIDAGWNIRV
jgi:LysM repeat protein